MIGMTNRRNDYLTIDFLSEFRKLTKFYEYDKRYKFYIVDSKDNKLFKWLIDMTIGRYDTPGILAIKNLS
jgi:hypothetical protein